MKIAIFSEYYAPHHGGVEARVEGIAGALVALGHAVTIFTVGYDRALPTSELLGGVRVERCPAPGYGAPLLATTRRHVGSVLRYAFWARHRARDAFDLYLYEEFPFLHAALAPESARRRGVFDWCEYRTHPVFNAMQRWLPGRFRWNTAVSEEVARQVGAASGQRVLALPSGIRVNAFKSRPRAERSGLVYLGRLWPHKHLPLAIEAFERLCAAGYAGHFTIAGRGPEERTLRARIAASPVRERIVMPGAVTEAEKVDLLAGAEAFLILSEREGFPAAVSEAMASGLPVITADYPGNGSVAVVKRYRAGAVSAPDADAVVNAVNEVFGDWEAYSARCLAAAAELDWKALVAKLLARDLGIGVSPNS